jgi:hypothetical protein
MSKPANTSGPSPPPVKLLGVRLLHHTSAVSLQRHRPITKAWHALSFGTTLQHSELGVLCR